MPRHDDDDYDDSNRAFLQAFMARSTMTFSEAKPVLAAILSAEETFQTYIAATNSAISPFDLEVRSIQPQPELESHDDPHPAIPERVYALVNTTSDALTQLATTFSADEIAFVKRVLDAMFETYNTRRAEVMVISSMQALQLAKVSGSEAGRRESGVQGQGTQAGGAAQSLTMSQAEMMLKQLVEQGWFEKSRKGYFRLSPRGLMELRGWLVATYNDDAEGIRKVKFCAACKEIITVGQRCEDRDCPGRLHDHCIRRFFRMQKADTCPVCKKQWPGDKFVGERAITSTAPSGQRRRRTTNNEPQAEAGPSTEVPAVLAVPDIDEDEDQANHGILSVKSLPLPAHLRMGWGSEAEDLRRTIYEYLQSTVPVRSMDTSKIVEDSKASDVMRRRQKRYQIPDTSYEIP
ncbi:hypothetical protein BO70DRAFT_428601 [Aspergillus heteromorphus CBS 117.55]|uniref:Non-structural maintenance of chromosomes element 1 homolog n=1 Tax=Aspergillus heteromorphus CBS 117.55 TaxID=1448321 RepID=A0A317WEY2_9EURO|nr:uncharacterized protein BO70DRAFT_428601 [Aspergillus heteromorphus CBS 117.55]PWY85036.1 hypothetical protein BO70DRAFT_428601 [Aspergillus heteromorphus CBS 117.55]